MQAINVGLRVGYVVEYVILVGALEAVEAGALPAVEAGLGMPSRQLPRPGERSTATPAG